MKQLIGGRKGDGRQVRDKKRSKKQPKSSAPAGLLCFAGHWRDNGLSFPLPFARRVHVVRLRP